MNKTLISLVIAGSTLLTACNEKVSTPGNGSATPPVVSKENAVASVNGSYISKTSLESLEKELAQRSQGKSFPKEKLVDELIQRELLIQDATQKKLDQTPEYNEQLVTIKQSLLSQAAIQNYIKSNPITDAELRAEYDKNITKAGDEYQASHILVKTEKEAKDIIADLKKGADFAELAKKKSTGPSGPKGGDLGWFASAQMVPPFSEAVIALEDNKFTTEPVKTQFGYHVILRKGSRSQTPPSFESVKEQIRPMLQRQKVQTFLTTLRSQAQVEVLLPKDKAPAVSPAPISKNKEAGQAVEANPQATATEQAKSAVAETGNAVSEKAAQTTEAVKEKVTEKANQAVDVV
ncbi:MAG: peptidylprolyl isomerase, partial [Methylococcaceae bacterium]|nr:peptidylprolyl isomerase [Methylococcaceae bacterium]